LVALPQGVLGECGLRGGYVELTNFHPGTVDELYKSVSINLSPNTIGQVAMSLMVNPPQPGQESYEQWKKEHDEGLASLRWVECCGMLCRGDEQGRGVRVAGLSVVSCFVQARGCATGRLPCPPYAHATDPLFCSALPLAAPAGAAPTP